MRELEGKVAIVTGAGRLRGIGRATAVALAKMGASVVVTGTGRDPSTYPPDEKAIGWRDIESTAEQIRACGSRALPIVGDVSKPEAVQHIIDATLKEFGKLHILVHNAAYPRGADRVPIDQVDEQVWRRVFDIKVFGCFLFAKRLGPLMIKQKEGGRIITVSSIAGKRGSANVAAYCAANAALQSFTQSLSLWLAPHRISCNTICPGVTDTSRMDDLGYPRGEKWEATLKTIPLRRAATDDEIAGLIAFLCSPAGEYVTGQSINIDGGIVMW